MKTDDRYTDAYGRVIIRPEALFELLYAGHKDGLGDALVENDEMVGAFNEWCRYFDKPELALKAPSAPDMPPEEWHAERCREWLLPDEYADLDVVAFILARCQTPAERDRVNFELTMFEARGLFPLLRFMIYLVHTLRENGIVWGVGRGSSCASYVLYKIGIHRIDALQHNLDVKEFLK